MRGGPCWWGAVHQVGSRFEERDSQEIKIFEKIKEKIWSFEEKGRETAEKEVKVGYFISFGPGNSVIWKGEEREKWIRIES